MKDYRRIAEDFAHDLKAKYGDRVERIVLFGSVARGDHRADSDIDLLVVTRDDRLRLQEGLSGDMVDLLLREGVIAVPLVVTASEAEKLRDTGFGREVAREGLAIA